MDEQTQPITEYECTRFLNYPGEKVIVALREHQITILPSLLILTCVTIFLIFCTAAVYYFTGSFLLLVSSLLTSVLIGLTLLVKTLLDWYFHVFVITNRKVLEFRYSPFSTCTINDILLDQVKCTEVDMQTEGMMHEFFDIGNVVMTFDRPTHQQEFTLSNIRQYRKVGALLCNYLVKTSPAQDSDTRSVWYRFRDNPERFVFREEASTQANRL